MQGWIKLHRQSIESAVFDNPNLWKVWCYCLLRANHKETKTLFSMTEITLKPGQFITGRFEGSKDCHMSPSTFRNQMDKLKKLKNLDIHSDNKKSIVTIVNWAQYQGNGEKEDSREDNKWTPNGHRQECKNDKNNTFDLFWKIYDKKINKRKCNLIWDKITDIDKEKIFATLPIYLKATPEKIYRKHPKTYLENQSWEDEVILNQNKSTLTKTTGNIPLRIM